MTTGRWGKFTANSAIKLVSKLSAGETSSPQRFTSAGWILFSWANRSGRSSSSLPNAKSLFQSSCSSSYPLQLTRHLRQRAQRPTQIEKGVPIPNRFTNMDRYQYILKPFAFTAFVGASSVVGCTIWQYEEYRKSVVSGRFSLSALRNSVFGDPATASSDLRSINGIYDKAEAWWKGLSPGDKIFWPICAINSVVWLAWRVPSWAPTMVTYFSATPVGRRICLPMLLSTFSHYSFFHLCANMFVLHSFIPAAAQILGKEQFVAMYLTSGTVASLGSHLHKLFIGNATPSLGASGAIMGILGLVCTRMPETQLGIIFLPGVQFTADTALKCILAVDCAGVLFGWRFMDHAAHLSGCLFGIAFSHWGGQTFWAFRDYVMTHWHKFRMSRCS